MPDDLGSGGYHWQAQVRVDDWEMRQQALAKNRRGGFAQLLHALPCDRSAALRVLDLGAGDGRVAELILEAYPDSSAVLVDFSQPMIELGKRRLECLGNRFAYVTWDMNAGGWPDALVGPYHAVVSSAAIHHLTNARKRWLAARVFEHLMTGGLYANYDLHRNPEAQFAEAEVHDRTCATVDEATAFLRAAGFVDVEVTAREPRPSHQGELALILGRRSHGPCSGRTKPSA